jgi:hypothetical protein
VDKLKLSTANLVILIAGVVMLISSFLAFNKVSRPSVTIGAIHIGGSVSYSAWSSHLFLIATIPALIGIVMAAQVAVVAFASGVKLPETVLGLTWNQIHLVLGFQAAIMMLAFLIQDSPLGDKGIGLFGMLIAAIGLLVGAVLRAREAPAAPPVV